MNQNEIEAFLAIIECGSIKGAADKLYIGQPTLSTRIKSLENELNARLLKRKRGQRNTELTVEGKKFEQYARKWIELYEDSKNAVKDVSHAIINIASCHSVNAYIMPEVYNNLSLKTRESLFRLWTQHYNEVFTMVESGEIDIGFVSKLQYSKEAKVYPLFSEEMVLLAENNGSYEGEIHPKHLDIRKEIYIDWDDNFRKWHKYWLGPSKSVLLQTSDVTSLKHLIRNGEKWAIVPITVAKKMCKRGEFCFCHLADKPISRTTSLICRDEIDTYPVMKEMIPLMEKVIEELGGEWLFQE